MEQGGCASDRIYRLVNNEQLDTAQSSELGIDLGLSLDVRGSLKRQVISAVGQADDVALVSSSLHSLKTLLHLTKIYCCKYQVKLVSSKTKLLVFSTKYSDMRARLELATTSIEIDGSLVSPSSQATHVGVIRCPNGNAPNIAARLAGHRKAVSAVMHAGLASGLSPCTAQRSCCPDSPPLS